ncbi:unnamed protein product [Prunus brigantina]
MERVVEAAGIFNKMIVGGKWKEATRLLNEMVSKNIFPDVFTFRVLVDTLCKEGMVVEAEGVVEMIIQRDIDPNTVTYTSLMDDEAMMLFLDMSHKGLVANTITYNTLADGFLQSG